MTALAVDEKVLVLNRLYTALRVVSARRALTLLFNNRAEIISVENGAYLNYSIETWIDVAKLQREFEPHAHTWIRTPTFEMAVPKIIRLLGYDRLPRQHVKLTRRNIFARDRNRCQYCGKTFPTSELSLDHVVPRVQGGDNSWENIVCSCVRCNARKGGRTPTQARMSLITKPARPKRNPTITLRLGEHKYHSWKAFLDDAYWHVELK
jgi:5-methylcytosine-specific restriction endonuclease McrA